MKVESVTEEAKTDKSSLKRVYYGKIIDGKAESKLI